MSRAWSGPKEHVMHVSHSCFNEASNFQVPPGSEATQSIIRPYNDAALTGSPDRVFMPASLGQVRAVIEQARVSGASLSVHSTGHDFEGRSLDGEMIVHMGAFTSVNYDPSTEVVTVGGGARISDVYKVLSAHGRAIPTGTSLDVGITGLTLGGGAGYTSRRYGLVCDYLLEVEICTFAGEVLHVTDHSHPRLMRMLRGAGAGTFGIVTQLKLKTFAATSVTSFRANWPASVGARHLADLEQILIEAPRELSMRIGANVTGSERVATITLSGQFQGDGQAELPRIFGSIARTAGWTQSTTSFYDAMISARHQTSGGAFKIKSRFAAKAMGAPALGEILDYLDTWTPTQNEDGAGFGLFAWGGAIRDFPVERSFMPARHSEYLASFDTSWTSRESPVQVAAQLRWLKELDNIGARYLSDIAYLNFPDSDDDQFFERHFPSDLREYEVLRLMYDPGNICRQASRCVHI
ncbi:FAD-dependent oxidoreductase [Burkholderia sp. AU30280]|uniref:FAD-binding oxidoreductase n=1 Tax=Burkholderia sp. AU30280 TaxID=2879628 RepID=UPI00299CEE53|nr:FAD-dependent oxidoreductase [Burkholderia sp. AU30280]